jgi:hypothetical protein
MTSDLDEFLPEAPSARRSARVSVVHERVHLDEFAAEASAVPPPAYASLGNGWTATLMVGGGLALAGMLSYFLFHS